MEQRTCVVLACLALAARPVRTAVRFAGEGEDYEVELQDPGEEVVLGRQGGAREPVVITLGELQGIFGITAEMVAREELSPREKRQARACRRQGELYRRSDTQCHAPPGPGLCPAGRWFVAVRGRLDGVCESRPCTDPARPVLFQGECSPVHGTCPGPASRLYINKRGLGFCECDDGFSYNTADGQCHRENTRGPCSSPRHTWLGLAKKKVPKDTRNGHKRFGRCRRTKCTAGQVKWRGGVCAEAGGEDRCVQSSHGMLQVEGGRLTCRMGEAKRGSDVGKLFFNGD